MSRQLHGWPEEGTVTDPLLARLLLQLQNHAAINPCAPDLGGFSPDHLRPCGLDGGSQARLVEPLGNIMRFFETSEACEA